MAIAETLSPLSRDLMALRPATRRLGRVDQTTRPVKQDRRNVQSWFNENVCIEQKSKPPLVANNNSSALIFYVQIEQKIFFPIATELADSNKKTGSDIHLHVYTQIIKKLRAGYIGRCKIGATVSVLDEYIHQHTLEEESENLKPV